ncbi:MAG: serine--tRNA ligase [bacterium]
MLDIKTFREREVDVRKALEIRGATADIGGILDLDRRRRALLVEVETLKGARNCVSKEISVLRKNGHDSSLQEVEMQATGDRVRLLDEQLATIEDGIEKLMLDVPNMPHSAVPVGHGEDGDRIVRVIGERVKFNFEPLSHMDLSERLGIIDFPRGTRMAGPGFPLFVGQGARLERALVQFMLDLHTREHGYTEMSPPFLCNEAALTGTGQLPGLADEMYRTVDGLYLVPTAEVPLTNYYRNEIIPRQLPVCFAAYTPCFRREAGAAGAETRGLLRVHQFDKVELVKFVEPSTSYTELEKLTADAEDVLKRLGLHYRVIELCASNLSLAAAKCYDIEVWSPARNGWLEVSSCSNYEAFQARRAGIRYRRADGKPEFVHTLNGSGVALARLVVALLEHYQTADGSVTVPEVIVGYMDGKKTLNPEH